jgi:hypothetical protein
MANGGGYQLRLIEPVRQRQQPSGIELQRLIVDHIDIWVKGSVPEAHDVVKT